MNAAERIRSYLDARYQDYVIPDTKGVIAYVPPSITGTEQELREADLEVLLQMLDLLAALITKDASKVPAMLDLVAERVENR